MITLAFKTPQCKYLKVSFIGVTTHMLWRHNTYYNDTVRSDTLYICILYICIPIHMAFIVLIAVQALLMACYIAAFLPIHPGPS